jgi:phage shock protein A
MNTFSRIKRILQATIDDIIEKARDPEMELARFLEDVELRLGEVRAERIEVELRRSHLSAKAAEQRHSAEEWMTKAERAAALNEDDLAKEALRRYHRAHEEGEGCNERLAEVQRTLETLLKDEAELEEKLKEARLEQKSLSMKLRQAESEKRSAAALMGADSATAAQDRMHGKIMDEEALSEAMRDTHSESLDAQLAALEKHPSLDDELANIKQRIRKGEKERS